jgi:hypothetical protein
MQMGSVANILLVHATSIFRVEYVGFVQQTHGGRRMRWVGHVARRGEKRNAYRILVGSQKERDHWEDQDIGGWTILKWMG